MYSFNCYFFCRYAWFYQGKQGWWKYDERTSADIEKAYLSKLDTLDVLIAGAVYIIDLKQWTQYQKNRIWKRREIKRDIVTATSIGVAGMHDGSHSDTDCIDLHMDTTVTSDPIMQSSFDPIMNSFSDPIMQSFSDPIVQITFPRGMGYGGRQYLDMSSSNRRRRRRRNTTDNDIMLPPADIMDRYSSTSFNQWAHYL